jgi:hypothetical protein
MSEQEPFSPEYQEHSTTTSQEKTIANFKPEPSKDVFSTEKLGIAKPEFIVIEGTLKHD